MPPIKIVTDGIGLINLVIAFLLALGGFYAAKAIIRKSTLEVLKTTNDALMSSNAVMASRLSEVETTYKGKIQTLEDSFHTQEKRLYRVEIDNERKGRQFVQAREEVRLLEMAVQIAVNCLSTGSSHPAEYERIMQLLTELSEFRRKATMLQDEWESAQSSTIAYMDTRIDMSIGRSQAK